MPPATMLCDLPVAFDLSSASGVTGPAVPLQSSAMAASRWHFVSASWKTLPLPPILIA